MSHFVLAVHKFHVSSVFNSLTTEMETYVGKILARLLVIVLITSHVVEAEKLSVESKIGKRHTVFFKYSNIYI